MARTEIAAEKEKGETMFNQNAKQFVENAKRFLCKTPLKRLTALLVMVVITVSSVITVMAATRDVNLTYNGETYALQTTSGGTQDILNQAKAQYPEIEVGPMDDISRSEDETAINLTVKSAYDATVLADGAGHTVLAYYGEDVEDVLEKAGVTLGVNDVVEPAKNEKVTDDTEITVTRRYEVSITADGETRELLAPSNTVAQTLEDQGISLGSDDLVSVNLEERVCDGMQIVVSRVTYQDVTVTEEIPYETTTNKDANLDKGKTIVEVEGQVGSQSVEKRQKFIDGQLAEETVLSTTVLKEPVTKVVTVGAKPKNGIAIVNGDGTLTDHNGNTIKYSKVVSGRSSAYTGGGYTSTGKPAAVGLVAVNPKIIPYGTRMYIASPDGKTVYGYAIAADTGGGVKSGRIVADLYYDTYNECINFGVRNMNLYILE